MDDRFANTPKPPYYAVMFSNRRTPGDRGYAEMSLRMVELALEQPGCLGVESSRDEEGFGITVSFWDSEKSIADWKSHLKHASAQRYGIEKWYEHYELRVAKVERAYSGPAGRKV